MVLLAHIVLDPRSLLSLAVLQACSHCWLNGLPGLKDEDAEEVASQLLRRQGSRKGRPFSFPLSIESNQSRPRRAVLWQGRTTRPGGCRLLGFPG
jgi:hypothetical protein